MMGGSMGGGGSGGGSSAESGDGGGGSGGRDHNQGPESGDGGGDGRGRTDPESGDGGDGRRSDNDDNSDDDNDNESQLTAKKIECPPGQEVPLFSISCQPTGSDAAQGAALAATACPTSPTPTSYMMPEELTVTNAVWQFDNNDHEIDAVQQLDKRPTLLHRVADGEGSEGTETNRDNDDFGTFGQQSTGASTPNPCPSDGDGSVSETRERLPDGGSKTTRTNQDGTSEVTILNLAGVRDPEGNLVPGAVEQVTKYNAQNKPSRTDSYDRSQNVVSTTNYDPASGNPTHTSNFAANGDVRSTAAYSYNAQNRLTQVFHLDSENNLLDRTINTYTPNNLPLTTTTYDSNNQPTSRTVYAGGDTPLSVTYYVDGKPISVTRYDESGQPIGTFGPDGKPTGSAPTTPPTPIPQKKH